jgi:hypothetical protein
MNTTIILNEATVAAVLAIAEAIKTAQRNDQAAQSGLRPGQSVVDVGAVYADEAKYKGKLNPDTLDRLDWAARVKFSELLPGDYDLFDRKPWIGHRESGMLYHAGDLASADLSGYYLQGSVFGKYLQP